MMHWTKAARVMSLYDAKSIQRDRFLIWAASYPLVIALALRFVLPWITERAGSYVDLTPYWPLLTGYVVLIASPMLTGLVVGFLMIEERDEGALNALMVTPLSLRNYMRYRAWLPALASIASVFACFVLAGLVDMSWRAWLMLSVAACPLGPICALGVAAFAENKVQALGGFKIFGTVAILPVALYFVPQPWQYMLAIATPHYWVCRAYWAFVEGEALAYLFLAIAVVAYGVVLAWLTQRYAANIYARA